MTPAALTALLRRLRAIGWSHRSLVRLHPDGYVKACEALDAEAARIEAEVLGVVAPGEVAP